MTVKDLKDLIVECLNESDMPVGGLVSRIKLKGFSQSPPDDQLQTQLDSIAQKYYPSLYIKTIGYQDHIDLKELNATKDAPVGTGSSYMRELTQLADSKNLQIKLVLAKKDYGAFDRKKTTSVERLRKFYSKFGFKDKSGLMVREPNGLNERNTKVSNYSYYGFTQKQEDDVHDKIYRYHQIDDGFEKEKIKNEFETLYQYIVGRNPILNNIGIDQPNYKSKNTPSMDVVNGVISGIPPEDIKNFVELTKGAGGTYIPAGYERDKEETNYIKIKKID